MQFTTKFTYSALGQLLTSIDPEDNYTYYVYDMLGRLIQREHPDAGQTIMEYDDAGNLSELTKNVRSYKIPIFLKIIEY